MRVKIGKKIFVLVGMVFVVGILFFFLTKKEENYTQVTDFEKAHPQGYAGSHSCKECHLKEYEEWRTSDHFKAMEIANDSTVLGDFDNQTYTADGITSRFFKKNNKFFINTQSETGENKDYEILYTFGHYPLQQYLVAFDKGRLQVTRQSWDSRQKKWFHQYEKQKIPHDDWLHWTGNSQNWNLMCASCHSTNLKKNYDPITDTYSTTYNELTVGCESCHGAGKRHNSFMKSTEYLSGKSKETYISAKNSMTQYESLQTCFPCHSRRGELSQNPTASTEILDNYLPEIPTKELYFADGQAYDEVYKYTSFLQSKMHAAGVKCTDCHNPHTGKLKAEGDKVCMQCHTPSYATPSHTFHKEGEASDCRSCHMPTRTYMGNDVRHDHNFAVPRPDLSEKYNVPNACNDCHKDKSARWAKEAIEKWCGKDRKPHFAEDLILASEQNQESLPHIRQLLSNPSTPDIIRATAVHYLGGIPSEISLHLLVQELDSKDAQTRYRAVLALMNFPINSYQNKAITLLNDKVRAVRVASANLILTQLGIEKAKTIPAFEPARKELETFVLSQSDFAVGSATAADYYVNIGDVNKAILLYNRALQKDKMLNYVRLNLANLYNRQNQNEKALSILKEAVTHEPKNPQIHYYLALLYNELGDLPLSKEAFEKTIKYGMNQERVQRNYQLLLEKMKK